MAGRPRDFDEEQVLERATDLFWRQGFEPTSLSDLLDHMGLSRQSLYNTFGGKEQLFHRVLDYYIETRMAPMLAGMEAEGADLRAIEVYFDALARGSTDPEEPRNGCLIVNTVVEQAQADCDAAERVTQFSTRIEKALLNALRGAQAAEQLKASIRLPEAAKFLATLVHGLMTISKVGTSRRQQLATARLALTALRAE